MLGHCNCLFVDVRPFNDWSEYRALSQKFVNQLRKYNDFLKIKTIKSGNTKRLYVKRQRRREVSMLCSTVGANWKERPQPKGQMFAYE